MPRRCAPLPQEVIGEARAASGSGTRRDGSWWNRVGEATPSPGGSWLDSLCSDQESRVPGRPGTRDQAGTPASEQRKEGRRGDLWLAAAGPLRTERLSVLSEPNSGVEDATRAGGRGQGRRRGREESESAAARRGATARALLALRQGPGGVRGAASPAFLVSPRGSQLAWRNYSLAG